MDARAEFVWVERYPRYSDPCDGGRLVYLRPSPLGDLCTAAGRAILQCVSLDAAAAEFPGVPIRLQSLDG